MGERGVPAAKRRAAFVFVTPPTLVTNNNFVFQAPSRGRQSLTYNRNFICLINRSTVQRLLVIKLFGYFRNRLLKYL